MTTIQFVDDPVGSHVKQIGKGHPIIFLHDFLGPELCWYGLETLLAEYCQIFLTTLPGFCRNDSIDSINSHDHLHFIRSVYDYYQLKSAVVVGVGIGASLALQHALLNPDLVKGLVLFHPAGLNKISNALLPLFSWLRMKQKYFKNTSRLQHFINTYNLAEPDRTQNTFSVSPSLIEKAIYHYSFDKPIQLNKLHAIRSQILLFWGRQDKLNPVKYAHIIEGYINSVHLKIFNDKGYQLIHDNQNVVFQMIHHYIKFQLKIVSHMP